MDGFVSGDWRPPSDAIRFLDGCNMKRQTCITLCSIHLLALAISTYIAAIRIESILVTGWICSATGVALGISANVCKRSLLAAVGYLTPIIAVILVFLENFIFHLGPGRAALPFCIVFIFNQVFATLTILVQLNLLIAPAGWRARQVTIKTLMVSMVSFSVFFAVARHLLKLQHNWLMAVALGLLGLTFVGLSLSLYSAIANRNTARIAT